MTLQSLFVALALSAPIAAAAASAPSTMVAPADLREDFAILRHALEEAHPGLYRFTPRAEMDRVFDEAGRGLDRPMDAWQFYRVLAPVIASVRCGHTHVELPDSLTRQLNSERELLPLQVRVLGGRIWIHRDLTTEDGRLEGDELLAVNGVPAAKLLETMARATAGDGFVTTHTAQVLRRFRFAGLLERLYGFGGTYDVELRDSARGVERLSLRGATIPELTQRLAKRHPEDSARQTNGEFELLDDGRIARLKLRGFGGMTDDSGKVDVRTFFRRSFESMRDHGTQALILDLRDNGGGEDALGRILFGYLVDRPFRYYDDLVLNDRGFSFMRYTVDFDSIPASAVEQRSDGRYRAKGHPNWGTQQPESPHFAGRVYVLENGASFSTTCEFMSHVRDAGRATFVGEESGGAYVGNTSGGSVHLVLPHSGMQVGIPILRYDIAVAPARPFGRGILADVPVTYTIADVLAGRDNELATALELARKPAGR
jgi:hypothetical protein